ncbi:MAG TPA: penicillin-binding transpeptidase domain-containing protein [Asanoa sp.]
MPSGRGGIMDAQAYTPRGRTVRDMPPASRTRARAEPATTRRRPAEPATTRKRPALTVVDGGRPDRDAPPRRGGARTSGATPARTSASGSGRRPPRTAPGRTTKGLPVPRRPPAPPALADPRRRLRLGGFLALALFAGIAIRLVSLQIAPTPAYAGGGVDDRLRTVTLFADRGAILDRSGATLAHSVEARYVFADPELVDDRTRTAAALSPLLGVARSTLEEKMRPRMLPGGGPSRFEWLARRVPVDTARRVTALNLAGIGVERDEDREAPGADLAANLIGITGEDGSGLEGLEAKYDQLLRGVNGKHTFEAGQGMLDTAIPGGYDQLTPAQPGSSLELTVDRDLQFEAQRILSGMMQNRKGSVGAAIVIDVKTGEVLAQASHPTFDVGDWQGYPPSDRQDAATGFVVDPGSVHKAIVFGAGLQEGVITPKTTFTVPNTVTKADVTFADTHPANGRRISMPAALAYSSNVTTIKIADLLGAQRLHDYQVKFGLGRATGEGMPGEAAGRVLEPSQWSGSSYGAIPIGHSVDVTPLQMASVYAAIANNGTWLQPHLVKATIAGDGTRIPAAAPQTRVVLSPRHAAQLRTLLEAVTTMDGATGTAAAIKGYRVAGKTGTGKRIVDGQYVPGDVASFVGMSPAENPRYVVAVFAHTPAGEGGDVAAPAFHQIMQYTLRHYRTPPSTAKSPRFVAFP